MAEWSGGRQNPGGLKLQRQQQLRRGCHRQQRGARPTRQRRAVHTAAGRSSWGIVLSSKDASHCGGGARVQRCESPVLLQHGPAMLWESSLQFRAEGRQIWTGQQACWWPLACFECQQLAVPKWCGGFSSSSSHTEFAQPAHDVPRSTTPQGGGGEGKVCICPMSRKPSFLLLKHPTSCHALNIRHVSSCVSACVCSPPPHPSGGLPLWQEEEACVHPHCLQPRRQPHQGCVCGSLCGVVVGGAVMGAGAGTACGVFCVTDSTTSSTRPSLEPPVLHYAARSSVLQWQQWQRLSLTPGPRCDPLPPPVRPQV